MGQGQAAVATSHLHPQLGAHPSLLTQRKRHQSIHHPCARSPRSGLPASAGRRPGSRLSHSQAGQGDRCCCRGAGLRHVRGDSSALRSQGGQPGPPSPVIPARAPLCPCPLCLGRCSWAAGLHWGSWQACAEGRREPCPGPAAAVLAPPLPSSCSSCLAPAPRLLLGRVVCGSLATAPWSSAAGWARGGHRAVVATPSCHPTRPHAGTSLGTVQGKWGAARCPPGAGTEVGGSEQGTLHGALRAGLPWPWGCSARSRPPCLSQDYVDALLTNYCVSAGAR